jgi:hypothetical protein
MQGTHLLDFISYPHPRTFKPVLQKKTPYVKAEGKGDTGNVSGALALLTNYDDYDEVVGEPSLVLLHKYQALGGTPSKDESVTKVTPDSIRSLKERFPKVFTQYEKQLIARGEEVPLSFLSSIKPDKLYPLIARGIKTVNALASAPSDQFTDIAGFEDLKARASAYLEAIGYKLKADKKAKTT